MNCEKENIVYIIECQKCQMRYVGESKRSLKNRLADHRGYVNRDMINTATGAHFLQLGHSLSHLQILIVEKKKNSDNIYRKEHEKYFINMLNIKSAA